MITLVKGKCWTLLRKLTPSASLPLLCILVILLKMDQELSGCTVKQIRKIYAWEIPQKKPYFSRWRWSNSPCGSAGTNARRAGVRALEGERDHRNSFYRGNTHLSCFKMTMKPQSKDCFTASLSFSKLSCSLGNDWFGSVGFRPRKPGVLVWSRFHDSVLKLCHDLWLLILCGVWKHGENI